MFKSDSTERVVISVARVLQRMRSERNPVVNNVDEWYAKQQSCSYDNYLRYQAQSILTSVIDFPELPTIEQARDIIAWASRSRAQ